MEFMWPDLPVLQTDTHQYINDDDMEVISRNELIIMLSNDKIYMFNECMYVPIDVIVERVMVNLVGKE